jgi:hypothetical protein
MVAAGLMTRLDGSLVQQMVPPLPPALPRPAAAAPAPIQNSQPQPEVRTLGTGTHSPRAHRFVQTTSLLRGSRTLAVTNNESPRTLFNYPPRSLRHPPDLSDLILGVSSFLNPRNSTSNRAGGGRNPRVRRIIDNLSATRAGHGHGQSQGQSQESANRDSDHSLVVLMNQQQNIEQRARGRRSRLPTTRPTPRNILPPMPQAPPQP